MITTSWTALVTEPSDETTRNVTRNLPAETNSCEASRPVAVPRSPKSQSAVNVPLVPVTDPAKSTVSPGTTRSGAERKSTTGAPAVAVTVCALDAVAPALSVTVRVTVYVPPVAYSCVVLSPAPVVPSPNDQL